MNNEQSRFDLRIIQDFAPPLRISRYTHIKDLGITKRSARETKLEGSIF